MIDLDALRAQSVNLIEQRLRINHHAIADDAGLARMGDARRNQVQNEFMIDFATANDDGVAGVMAALIASDDVEMWREQVNDLAFAFLSPLGADDCEVHVCGLWGQAARAQPVNNRDSDRDVFGFRGSARLKRRLARRRLQRWRADRSGERTDRPPRTSRGLWSPLTR